MVFSWLLWVLAASLVLFIVVGVVILLLPKPETPLFKAHNENIVRNDDENIGEVFLRRAAHSPHRGAYYEKLPDQSPSSSGAQWQKTTWEQFAQRSRAIARGITELDVCEGSHISVLGRTCGRWCELDVGIHLAGCVSIGTVERGDVATRGSNAQQGIYPKQAVAQLVHQIGHSDTVVVFTETLDDTEDVLAAVEELQKQGESKVRVVVPWIASINDALSGHHMAHLLHPYSLFEEEPISEKEMNRRLVHRRGTATAIIVYTSGVTGPSKGVMLSHRNLIAFATCGGEPFFPYDDDLVYSFLPMAHVAERCISFYARIAYGQTAVFCSNMRNLLKEVDEVKPTIFGAVPRIFEKAHGRIYAEVAKRPAPLPQIFSFIMNIGIQRFKLQRAGKAVPLHLRVAYALADHYCYRIIRRFFLGGRVQRFVTGAAPLSLDILEFFWALDLQIYEVYGMSEATGVTHANTDREWRLGSVGKALPGVETRIAEDGEIHIRCGWVFEGYYKDAAKTDEALVDGWLCTGDIGQLEDGYLKITDRKKHIIITAGGKNLSPNSIEAAIKRQDPVISHVHAHGDRRPYVTAIIVPGPLETLEWGERFGIVSPEKVKHHTRELMADPTARSSALDEDMAQVTVHPEFVKHIQSLVAEGNKSLMQVESIKAFILLDRDFSQEHGELTPTMKAKRKYIENKWREEFDRLYTDPSYGVHFSR